MLPQPVMLVRPGCLKLNDMKKLIQLIAVIVWLVSCKPAELQYMDNLGRKVTMHTDTTLIRAELQREGMLILPKIEHTYYWYEKGRVNYSQGAYSGKVLHGQYRAYDRQTKRPLQSGKFNRGLKSGRWLTWNLNGLLEQAEIYSEGQLDGPLVKYDGLGNPSYTLKYNHGLLVIEKAKTGQTLVQR